MNKFGFSHVTVLFMNFEPNLDWTRTENLKLELNLNWTFALVNRTEPELSFDEPNLNMAWSSVRRNTNFYYFPSVQRVDFASNISKLLDFL